MPVTLLSVLTRYGTFNLAEIVSRQNNLSSFGMPQIGFLFDPINGVLFFGICLIKYKEIKQKRLISGHVPYELASMFQLYTLLLLGLYLYLGGTPRVAEFNIDSIYNDVIQTVIAVAYLLLYTTIMSAVLSWLSRIYFPLSEIVLERSIWVKFLPTSIFAFIFSISIFVLTGGRF